MAISRAGFRELTVDGRTYAWRVLESRKRHPEDSQGVRVHVVTEAAFVPGHTGQALRFRLPLGWIATPLLVRWAIEAGSILDPPFTGIAGGADIELPSTLWWHEARQQLVKHLADMLERVEPCYRQHREAVEDLARVGEHQLAFEMLEDHAEEITAPTEFFALLAPLLDAYPTRRERRQ
jgi:hypothetical protein